MKSFLTKLLPVVISSAVVGGGTTLAALHGGDVLAALLWMYLVIGMYKFFFIVESFCLFVMEKINGNRNVRSE